MASFAVSGAGVDDLSLPAFPLQHDLPLFKVRLSSLALYKPCIFKNFTTHKVKLSWNNENFLPNILFQLSL
jgi:hypothetical protein